MLLNNTNWTTASSILHPLINLPGIQSVNNFNIKEINARLAIIRNNQHALLNTLSNFSKKIDGFIFISELVKSFSEINYRNDLTCSSDLLADSDTTLIDIGGNKHVFTERHTHVAMNGVGSIQFKDNLPLLFVNGILLKNDKDYKVVSLNGSLSLFVKTSLLSLEDEIIFITIRKFNRYGVSINKRAQHVLTAGSTSANPYILTLAKSDIGILHNNSHIQIYNEVENKLLSSDEYSISDDLQNIDRVRIKITATLSEGTLLKFFNQTEFGQVETTTKAAATLNTIRLNADGDNTILPVTNKESINIWVNGRIVPSKFIEIGNGNTYIIKTSSLPYISQGENMHIFAYKTSVNNISPELKNSVEIAKRKVTPLHPYVSVYEDLDGKGLFIEDTTTVFHGGKLVSNINFLGNGDRIKFTDNFTNDEDIFIKQNFIVSSSCEDLIYKTIRHIREHNGWLHTNILQKEIQGGLVTLADSSIDRMKENIVDIFNNYSRQKQTNEVVEEIADYRSHVDRELKFIKYDLANIPNPGLTGKQKGIFDSNLVVSAFSSSYHAEIMRFQYGTGLIGVRNYAVDSGFDGQQRPHIASNTAMFQHNHPNYYRMVGLGELAGVANGYYFRTGHRDPRLLNSLGEELNAPPIPKEVLSKPTGIGLNSDGSVTIDTASDTQAKYMRTIYTENIQDTRLDLLYCEVWLEKLSSDGELENNIESFRHNENANKLLDLLKFGEKLTFAGIKDPNENTSFRSGLISIVNENGEPEFAYVNFRLTAQTVGSMANRTPKETYTENDLTPEITLNMVASTMGGTHGHALKVQLSASDMNTVMSGETIYVESSFDKAEVSPQSESHSHLVEIKWNGSKLVGVDIAARGEEGGIEGNSFVSVSVTNRPTINKWKDESGNYRTETIQWIADGAHAHPVLVRTTEDKFPFDLYKAVHHIIDNTNRWKLIKDYEALNRLKSKKSTATWKDLAESGLARWTLDQDSMDSIISSCWGLDGEGAYLYEEVENHYKRQLTTYDTRDGQRLNAAKYNRVYRQGTVDAAGRSIGVRGFNDPTLYLAKTTKPEVVEGYSYIIPLEIILRSPTEVWNPWDLIVKNGYPNVNTAGSGRKTDPRDAVYTRLWYAMLPPGFFKSAINDPADTNVGGQWTMANDGNAYPADSSGIFISIANAADYKDANGDDYSKLMRFRYVIAPDANIYSHNHVQLVNFKERVKQLLELAVDGSLSKTDIDNLL